MRLKKQILISEEEIFEFDAPSICVSMFSTEKGDYSPETDEKWLKFCKEHNFNSKNTRGKIYNLYLEMCAEGML